MRNRIFVHVLCVALLNLASPQAAQAALVGTLQAVEASGTRAQDLAIVNAALAREQVRARLEKLDPTLVPPLPEPTMGGLGGLGGFGGLDGAP